MTNMTKHHLSRARQDRRLAQRARHMLRDVAGRPASEQLRLYAAHLETAGRALVQTFVATRPRDRDWNGADVKSRQQGAP
jgi:hypothetical protein